VNCNYFIPNVIGSQACSFIGKFRMRPAAGGAPVAVKQSRGTGQQNKNPLFILNM
jgi:hypothetical protein